MVIRSLFQIHLPTPTRPPLSTIPTPTRPPLGNRQARDRHRTKNSREETAREGYLATTIPKDIFKNNYPADNTTVGLQQAHH